MINLKDLKVYVINLDRRTDRWNEIEILLKNQGFSNIQRMSAIDGKLIDSFHVKKIVDPSIYNQLGKLRNNHEDLGSLGAVGCYLSHYKIWQDILKTNTPAIIIEDDIKFEENWDQHNIVKNSSLLKNYDFALLGYATHIPLAPSLPSLQKNTLLPFHKQFFMTHFYYLTPEGAQFFLNQSLPMKYQVDSYMSMKIMDKMGLKFKSAIHIPSLAGQKFGSTDIQTPMTLYAQAYFIIDYVKYYTCSPFGLYLFIIFLLIIFIYMNC